MANRFLTPERPAPPESLGEGLAMLRRKAGLSRAELGELASLTPETIRNYELDAVRVTFETLRRLVAIIAKRIPGASTDELCCELGEIVDATLANGNGKRDKRERIAKPKTPSRKQGSKSVRKPVR